MPNFGAPQAAGACNQLVAEAGGEGRSTSTPQSAAGKRAAPRAAAGARTRCTRWSIGRGAGRPAARASSRALRRTGGVRQRPEHDREPPAGARAPVCSLPGHTESSCADLAQMMVVDTVRIPEGLAPGDNVLGAEHTVWVRPCRLSSRAQEFPHPCQVGRIHSLSPPDRVARWSPASPVSRCLRFLNPQSNRTQTASEGATSNSCSNCNTSGALSISEFYFGRAS